VPPHGDTVQAQRPGYDERNSVPANGAPADVRAYLPQLILALCIALRFPGPLAGAQTEDPPDSPAEPLTWLFQTESGEAYQPVVSSDFLVWQAEAGLEYASVFAYDLARQESFQLNPVECAGGQPSVKGSFAVWIQLCPRLPSQSRSAAIRSADQTRPPARDDPYVSQVVGFDLETREASVLYESGGPWGNRYQPDGGLNWGPKTDGRFVVWLGNYWSCCGARGARGSPMAHDRLTGLTWSLGIDRETGGLGDDHTFWMELTDGLAWWSGLGPGAGHIYDLTTQARVWDHTSLDRSFQFLIPGPEGSFLFRRGEMIYELDPRSGDVTALGPLSVAHTLKSYLPAWGAVLTTRRPDGWQSNYIGEINWWVLCVVDFATGAETVLTNTDAFTIERVAVYGDLVALQTEETHRFRPGTNVYLGRLPQLPAGLRSVAPAQVREGSTALPEAAPAERTNRSRGVVTEFELPSGFSASPQEIALGPDGALWFTQWNRARIGRITPNGLMQEFALPTIGVAGGFSNGVAAGADGAVWFTRPQENQIGRSTTDGQITSYSPPTQGSPDGIVSGPDGALWFTEYFGNRIGRITPAGTITEFLIPTPGSGPNMIARGPDDALWFTETRAGQIGRITTSGLITEFALPDPDSTPMGIAAGPDGVLWFTETGRNHIGRLTTTGELTEHPLLPGLHRPDSICLGPDGALWFTTQGDVQRRVPRQIGRISTDGTVTTLLWNDDFAVGSVATGPDGALWFTQPPNNRILRLEVQQASDQQSLLSQAQDTQQRFRATWRDQADYQWVLEHDAELERLHPPDH
jgi:virginiamycin B lyase